MVDDVMKYLGHNAWQSRKVVQLYNESHTTSTAEITPNKDMGAERHELFPAQLI